jgi:hypothetical protein
MVINIKKHFLKNTRGPAETRQEDRIHYENAYNAALSTLNLQNINIKTWLKELTREQLQEILKIIPDNTRHIEDQVKRISNHMKEIISLGIVGDKIVYTTQKLSNLFVECFTIQYTKIKGKQYKWNLDRFKYDVESQLDKLNNNNNNMEADI